MKTGRVVSRMVAFALALLFLSAPFSGAAQYVWTPAEPCFEGAADYQYLDDGCSVQIKKYHTSGLTYFVADVQIEQASRLQTALSGGKDGANREGLSVMAERSGAVLALNADDYGTHKYGIIIRNGELLRARGTSRHLLIVDAFGDMTVRADRSDDAPKKLAQELVEAGAWQTFEFGPELIRDGAAVDFPKSFTLISTGASRREPRTAIGQIAPLHYVIVVADGRQKSYSKGMTLQKLQEVFLECGAQTAMNLDGGGSTELWFRGEIINRPSQGKERGLSDIIYF